MGTSTATMEAFALVTNPESWASGAAAQGVVAVLFGVFALLGHGVPSALATVASIVIVTSFLSCTIFFLGLAQTPLGASGVALGIWFGGRLVGNAGSSGGILAGQRYRGGPTKKEAKQAERKEAKVAAKNKKKEEREE